MQQKTALMKSGDVLRSLGITKYILNKMVEAKVLRPVVLTPNGRRFYYRDEVEELANRDAGARA